MRPNHARLPPELLGKIFIHTLPDIRAIWEAAQNITCLLQWDESCRIPLQKSDYLVPFTVSSVCRHWNRVAIATKPLWSCILIDVEKDAAGFAAVQTWIKRSGASPVTFICGSFRSIVRYPPFIHQYLSIIFAEIKRWQNLYIIILLPDLAKTRDDAHISQLQTSGSIPISASSAPLLRKACVSVRSSPVSRCPEEEISIKPFRDSLFGILMSPGTTKLEEIRLDIQRPSCPTSFCVSHSLTKILILDIPTTTGIDLLFSCPNAEELTFLFSDKPGNHQLAAKITPSLTAFLPHLRHLDIECSRSISFQTILECLCAPSLSCLELHLHDHRPSNVGLRDAFTAFLMQSRCRISSLTYRQKSNTEDVSSTLPLEHHYWSSLEKMDVSGVSTSTVLRLHSISPGVKEMTFELPLPGTYIGLVHLPHIQQIVVKSTMRPRPAQNYQVLSNVDAPHLERISMSCQGLPWHHLALGDLISKSDSLSYMCLQWGWYHALPRIDPASIYLLNLLQLPNVNANLQTLILRCYRLSLSSRVMEYLTISPSRKDAAILPRLRNLAFIGGVDRLKDGQISDMVESRFKHGVLEFFYVHFELPIPYIYDPFCVPNLHLQDQRRLEDMMDGGRNVVVERGKHSDHLVDVVDGFQKRL